MISQIILSCEHELQFFHECIEDHFSNSACLQTFFHNFINTYFCYIFIFNFLQFFEKGLAIINNNDIISAKSMKKLIGYITFLNIIPIEYFRKDDIKTLFLFLFLIDKWIFTTVSTISQLKCSLLCRNLLLKFMKWNSSIIIDFLVCYVFVCVVYLLVMLIL